MILKLNLKYNVFLVKLAKAVKYLNVFVGYVSKNKPIMYLEVELIF
jgi:hypothetical protein